MRRAPKLAAILEGGTPGGPPPWNRFQKSGTGRVGRFIRPTPPTGVECKEDPVKTAGGMMRKAGAARAPAGPAALPGPNRTIRRGCSPKELINAVVSTQSNSPETRGR